MVKVVLLAFSDMHVVIEDTLSPFVVKQIVVFEYCQSLSESVSKLYIELIL